MRRHIAYTDGACSAGVGGWAVLLDDELSSGWMPNTTNNQMELFALLNAVQNCTAEEMMEVFTDSKLVIGWVQTDWHINQEPIRELVGAIKETVKLKGIIMHLNWVKGHNNNPSNHLVDRAAVEESKRGQSAILSRH